MTTTATNADPQNPEQPEQEGTEEDRQPDPRNAEAAKYRKRLREAEQQRDALQAELETYRASDTERLHDAARRALDDKLSYCARLNDETQAIMVETADLSKFLTEDGEVDQEAIDSYAERLQPQPIPRSGMKGWRSGRSGTDREGGGSGGGGWSELIGGRG